MRAAVVILNWNTREYLRAFLPTLIKSLGKDDALYVADSASTDGSLEMLAAEFPSVKTIPLDKNYGFTGGYNRALKDLEAEYFVLINSDVLVDEGWLEPLVAWMEGHPDCAICGPKLHGLMADPDSPSAEQSHGRGSASGESGIRYRKTDRFEYAGAAGGWLDAWGFPFCRGRVLNRVCEDRGQYDSPADVLWCTGACLMIRSRLWFTFGGFDGRFFAHMEEIDLCWRVQLSGFKVTVVPQSLVWHLGGGTLEPKSPWKLELNYRNSLLMLENNLTATYQARGLSVEKAVRKAYRRIAMRMCIDNLTRLIYSCTGRKEYAEAVKKAHAAYGMLRYEAAPGVGHVAVPRGLARICIIPQGLIRKDRVFHYLDKKIFRI